MLTDGGKDERCQSPCPPSACWKGSLYSVFHKHSIEFNLFYICSHADSECIVRSWEDDFLLQLHDLCKKQ